MLRGLQYANTPGAYVFWKNKMYLIVDVEIAKNVQL